MGKKRGKKRREKKRCCGDKKVLLPEAGLIGILVRLPVVSLLRFKSVSKSWCALIQSPSFIHLHTTLTTLKSSSSRFGSFIVHVAVQFPKRFRENALLMFSSSAVSSSESESSAVSSSSSSSWCSGSFGLWSTGFNGICGRCVTKYEPGTVCEWITDESGSNGRWVEDSSCIPRISEFEPGAGGWWWRNSDGLCGRCLDSHNFVVEEDDDQVVFSFLGGGGGGGVSNDEQQQQQLVLKLDNLGFPSCYNFGKPPPIVMVVGSCNGLICLYDEQSNNVSLWNPATRQFRILPKSITTTLTFDGDDDDDDCLHHRLFAFGFDAETKDYKVVLLSGFRLRPRRIIIIDGGGLSGPVAPMECICRVQVYSLSTDSWRLLEGINVLPGSPSPPYPPDSSSYSGQLLYLNGSCFFMAKFLYSEEQQCISRDYTDRFIISLDLTKEIIIPIQLPYNHQGKELYLCYLGKKIAYITTVVYPGCWELFHIWVLNEHCSSSSSSSSLNHESWTELHFFQIKLGLPGEWIIPRGISNDGVFVFLETETHGLGNKKKKKKMKLYNLVTNELKETFISCDQVLSKAYAYKPSLVSIIGGNGGSSSSSSSSSSNSLWHMA